MAWTDAGGNILPVGLSTLKVKASGDAGYYELPGLRDTSIVATQISDRPDSKQRESGIGIRVVIKAKVTWTGTLGNLIQLLQHFSSSNTIHVKADAINGEKFYSEAASVYMGCEWELVSEGDFAEARYVEFTFMADITGSEWNSAVTGSQSDGSPTGTDDLDGIQSLTIADKEPAVLTRLDFEDNDGGSWDDTLANIREGRFRASLQGTGDSRNRIRGTRIHIEASAQIMQTAEAELDDIDDYMARKNDYRIVFPGDYITLSDTLGVKLDYHLEGDSDADAYIMLTASGVILPSAWSALWTDGAPA